MYYLTKMEPDKMMEDLNAKKETLEAQLTDLEKTFNQKKEHYLKILGAIEALENLDPSVPPTITPHPKE